MNANERLMNCIFPDQSTTNQLKGIKPMFPIAIKSVLRLIARVKGITIESIDHECLLPFGCKLSRVNCNWYIKYYAYDKSDLKNLINQFPFLKDDWNKEHLKNIPINTAIHSSFLR